MPSSTQSSNVVRVPQDYPTIQAAIDASPPGSRIEIVAPGIYRENLKISKPLELMGWWNILEADPAQPAILIEDAGAVTIEAFQIQPQSETPRPGTPLQPDGREQVGVLIQGNTRAVLKYNYIQSWVTGVRVKSGASAVLEENSIWTDAAGSNVNGIVAEEAEVEVQSNKISIESSYEYVGGIYASDSRLLITRNDIYIFRGSREGAEALFLINSQGTISENRIVVRNAEGILINGSNDLSVYRNSITSDSVGIVVSKITWEVEEKSVRIQENAVLGYAGAVSGITVQNLRVEVQQNVVTGYESGIFLGFEGRGELKGNLIAGNQKDGVVVRRDALSALLQDNRILSNQGCGVRVEEALHDKLQSISGEGNWIEGNAQGDLCPSDYPWPPDFVKNP